MPDETADEFVRWFAPWLGSLPDRERLPLGWYTVNHLEQAYYAGKLAASTPQEG